MVQQQTDSAWYNSTGSNGTTAQTVMVQQQTDSAWYNSTDSNGTTADRQYMVQQQTDSAWYNSRQTVHGTTADRQ